MPRILVISFATMIKNSHWKQATAIVMIKMAKRTFASPLHQKVMIMSRQV